MPKMTLLKQCGYSIKVLKSKYDDTLKLSNLIDLSLIWGLRLKIKIIDVIKV